MPFLLGCLPRRPSAHIAESASKWTCESSFNESRCWRPELGAFHRQLKVRQILTVSCLFMRHLQRGEVISDWKPSTPWRFSDHIRPLSRKWLNSQVIGYTAVRVRQMLTGAVSCSTKMSFLQWCGATGVPFCHNIRNVCWSLLTSIICLYLMYCGQVEECGKCWHGTEPGFALYCRESFSTALGKSLRNSKPCWQQNYLYRSWDLSFRRLDLGSLSTRKSAHCVETRFRGLQATQVRSSWFCASHY